MSDAAAAGGEKSSKQVLPRRLPATTVLHLPPCGSKYRWKIVPGPPLLSSGCSLQTVVADAVAVAADDDAVADASVFCC